MSFEKRFFGLLLLAIGVICVGCTPPSDPMLEMMDADLKKTKVDDLARTMDFINSEVRFEQQEFKDTVSTGLNRWVSTSKELIKDLDGRWKRDTLSQPLMAANDNLDIVKRSEELSFLSTDGYYLQESAWISQIVRRVTNPATQLGPFELYRLAADNYKPDEDVDAPLVEVIKKLHPELDETGSEKLANSLSVFDWVVRNIQLLPESKVSADEVESVRLNNNEGNAVSGTPGLGYQRYPWQVLLYGRGDYVERAKLVMLGLRQLNIDSVMLATKNADGSSAPWAVGVVIGGEYYLFDTKLALPIPGEKTGSIATLAQVREKPELISSLDLTTDESLEDDTDYWVKPEQLKQLDALVYVSPESVSKRMFDLEASLVGDARMTLAFTADDIVSRLPKAAGVDVKTWDIGFETHQYRQAVRTALEQKSDDVLSNKLQWYYLNEFYIDNFVVYRTARSRFFKGKFSLDPEGTSLNAIQSCQRLKYTDEQIDNLGSDKTQQRRLGIRKEADQDVNSFSNEIRSVQNQMELIRRDAGLFLAQCLFDNGSMYASANWLNILKNEDAGGRWSDGVTYLLGRSQEKLKDYDQAIVIFSDPKLEQSHGNLIRVRMLKQLISKL